MDGQVDENLRDSSVHKICQVFLVYKDCEVLSVYIININFTNFKDFKDLADFSVAGVNERLQYKDKRVSHNIYTLFPLFFKLVNLISHLSTHESLVAFTHLSYTNLKVK